MATTAPPTSARTFPFAFDPLFRLASVLVGASPSNTVVDLTDDDELVAHYGPWTVRSPLTNVDDVTDSGPYAWPKVIGGPRLSLRDSGITFGTNARRGVCIAFRRPVRGIDPWGLVRHRGLTVTVADPEGLVRAVRARLAARDQDPTEDVEEELERIDEESHDELEGMTAAELRTLAKAEGITGVSKLRKDELVALIEAHEHAEATDTD